MRFKYSMPWEKRLGLVLFGVVGLAVSALALFLLGVLFWAVVAS